MIWTIERLKQLKSGEVMEVYRGDFAADIARCGRGKNPAPAMADLLTRLEQAMKALAAAGCIKVSSERVLKERQNIGEPKPDRWFETIYTAEGI